MRRTQLFISQINLAIVPATLDVPAPYTPTGI